MHEQRRENEARLASTAIVADLAMAGVERRVRVGNPGDQIVAAARAEGADLIVLGVHRRRGLDHLLRGSTAEHVLRRAPCHVLLDKLPA